MAPMGISWMQAATPSGRVLTISPFAAYYAERQDPNKQRKSIVY